MCQLLETRRPGWRNHKNSMKENSNRGTGMTRKTLHNKATKPRSQSTKHSTDNVLKRQRPLDRTTESEGNLDHADSGPARYVAYQSQRSGGSPLAQNLLQNCLDKTNPEVEKRLSPAPCRQTEDCCSPPAKIQMSSQATYAGAKFHDPPSPKSLPKPPNHWFICNNPGNVPKSSCAEMTSVIKVMLNVQS